MNDRSEYQREWKRKNSARVKQNSREYYLKVRQSLQEAHQALKEEVISEYGGVCKCCGEGQIEFLTIDHINNDGAAHRKEDGKKLYRWLKRNGYPKENFQILCMNCNWTKGRIGECPHQRTMILKDSLALMKCLDDMDVDYRNQDEFPVRFIKGAIPISLLRKDFLTVLSAALMEAS